MHDIENYQVPGTVVYDNSNATKNITRIYTYWAWRQTYSKSGHRSKLIRDLQRYI